MARKAPKTRFVRSRRSGLKKAKLIQSNHIVIEKVKQAISGLK